MKSKLDYKEYLKSLLESKERAILLYGDSGTGKSTLAKRACIELGREYTQYQCSANTDENNLVGGFIPNVKDKKSEFLLIQKALTIAFKEGKVCIIDELNLAQPDTLSLLNSMLDDVAILTLDDGEVIYRHEDFQLICTENVGLEGCKYMNAATLNRFYTIKIPELGISEIYKRLDNNKVLNIDFINDSLFVHFHDFYEALRKQMLDVNNILTYRNHEKLFNILIHLYNQLSSDIGELKEFINDLPTIAEQIFTHTFLDVFIENQYEIETLKTTETFKLIVENIINYIVSYFSSRFDLVDRPKYEKEKIDKEKPEKKKKQSEDKEESKSDDKKQSDKTENKNNEEENSEDKQESDGDNKKVTNTAKTKSEKEEKIEEANEIKVDLDVVLNEL